MTPNRRRALIAFKRRMAERWRTDPKAMLARSRAGGKARASQARRTRDELRDWLATLGTWHDKDQMLQRIREHDRTRKPSAWFRLMVSTGMIRFDQEQGRWLNLCQRI